MAELAVNTNALNLLKAIKKLPTSAANITFLEDDAMVFNTIAALGITIKQITFGKYFAMVYTEHRNSKTFQLSQGGIQRWNYTKRLKNAEQ